MVGREHSPGGSRSGSTSCACSTTPKSLGSGSRCSVQVSLPVVLAYSCPSAWRLSAPSSIPWVPRVIGLPRHLVLVALTAVLPLRPMPLEAQDGMGTSIAFSPYVGIGPIFDHGSHVAWSANVLAEIDLTRAPLRWSLFASVRGIGAACADGCDLSGESLGLAVTYLLGDFGVGGGMGLLHQSGSWYAQPHAMLSASRGAFRAQLRMEVPQGAFGVSFPVLFGFRIPII